MTETVFSKIVKGEIPCKKVYEDETFLAFLDIHPVKDGHVLVIPKQAYETFLDAPDDLLKEAMPVVKKVAVAIKKATNADRVSLLVIGEDVPHLHFQLVPLHEGDVAIQLNRQGNPEGLDEWQERITKHL